MTNKFLKEWVTCIQAGYPLIFVFTVEEERAMELLKQAAEASGRKILFPRIKGEASGVGELLLKADESNSLVVLDTVQFSLSDGAVIRALADAACGESTNKTIVIICPWIQVPRELERLSAVLELPLPSADVLFRQCARAAKEVGATLQKSEAAELVRVLRGMTAIEAFCIVKKALLSFFGDFEKVLSLVIREKKAMLRKSRVLESVNVPASMQDVGGMDRLKNWLIERKDAFSDEARRFGLPAPRGLLLMGVQGCGKSLMAKAVAQHWRLPLSRLDISAVFGSSQPEAVLREALMTAEAMAPTVLWIDEIEKGFDSRLEGLGSRLLGKMVTWLQEKQQEVFVVATANRVESLPPELSRKGRFDEVFFVDLPDVEERRDIFRIHLLKHGRNPDAFNLSKLVEKTEKFTGSELEQLIIAGMFQAFAAKRDLSEPDLLWACKETVPLFEMYEDEIKALREWARKRARPASTDRRKMDMFSLGNNTQK
jgi:SpoVK/Ycf46/Vps4 family AAA+-type ATPase